MNTANQYRIKYNAYNFTCSCLLFLFSCTIHSEQHNQIVTDSLPQAETKMVRDTFITDSPLPDHTQTAELVLPQTIINTGNIKPAELILFAETLIGVPYVYASTDPKVGFDCSGFITYVFKHFNIEVPRSSIDFTDVGKTVTIEQAKSGDLILFTGTNPMERNIGHMGIVVSNDSGGLQFIHSTSGKAMSVTISPFNEQYQKRFVRICRIFKQNE